MYLVLQVAVYVTGHVRPAVFLVITLVIGLGVVVKLHVHLTGDLVLEHVGGVLKTMVVEIIGLVIMDRVVLIPLRLLRHSRLRLIMHKYVWEWLLLWTGMV